MSSTLERTPTPPEVLDGCSIALKCANEPTELLERFFASIDDDVAVNVVATPNRSNEGYLRHRRIPYTLTEYGNIAMSTQLSVDQAEFDTVIIADADTYFLPESIRCLREALSKHELVKPRIVFDVGNGYVSKLIARHREPFNSQPDYASNPGLGFHRASLRTQCGGYIFNPLIRWTEDADLNHRVKKAGLTTHYVEEAVIVHDAITMQHELRAAFFYGIGKRLSIEHTPGRQPREEAAQVLRDVLKAIRPDHMAHRINSTGADVVMLDTIWQAIYLAGYHAQKRTGNWTVKG